MAHNARELALFNLALDSKLRACDLVQLRVRDIAHGSHILPRVMVMQQKTHRPVQFEITDPSREALAAWIGQAQLKSDSFLLPSRCHASPHLTTRQYARIVQRWIESVGLNPVDYGAHSLRRTKAALLYRRTKNLQAVQLLLGHTKFRALRIHE